MNCNKIELYGWMRDDFLNRIYWHNTMIPNNGKVLSLDNIYENKHYDGHICYKIIFEEINTGDMS